MRSMRAAFEEHYSSAKLPLTLSFRETLRQARRAAQQGRQAGYYWGLRWTAIMVMSSNWGALLIC